MNIASSIEKGGALFPQRPPLSPPAAAIRDELARRLAEELAWARSRTEP